MAKKRLRNNGQTIVQPGFQALEAGNEIELGLGFQRIFLFVDFHYLDKIYAAPPKSDLEPFLSFEPYGIVGFSSLSDFPRVIEKDRNFREIPVRLGGPSYHQRILMQVYQPVGRPDGLNDVPMSQSETRHKIDLQAPGHKLLIEALLDYFPQFQCQKGDRAAIVSYDVPLDATPERADIPFHDCKTFHTRSVVYENFQPVHFHIFDPPWQDVNRIERPIFDRIFKKWWFIDYPVKSYAMIW